MLSLVRRWVEHRLALRRRWQVDALTLIRADERGAYYAAQRRAWRARAAGDKGEFWHWAKVASEVARRSPLTEMDRHDGDADRRRGTSQERHTPYMIGQDDAAH